MSDFSLKVFYEVCYLISCNKIVIIYTDIDEMKRIKCVINRRDIGIVT